MSMGVVYPSLLRLVVGKIISVTGFPPTSNIITERIPLQGAKVSRYETYWAHSLGWTF